MANQIKGKFIKNGSIDGSKILIKNDQSLRVLRSDGAEEELFKLNSQNKFTLLKMPSISIDPTDMYDIVNKKYVDDEVYSEKTRAMMAEAQIEADIAAEESRAIQREDALEGMIEEEAIIRASEDVRILSESSTYTDAEVSEEASIRASEDVRILSESKAYTDAEVAEEASIRASEDVRILSESKAYTDESILSNVTNKLGQPSGIATLDANGKLSTSQLPAIGLTDVYVVTTLTERDALTVEEGDVVKVTEAVTNPDGTKLPRTYIYDGNQFVDLTTESDVDSVNGKVGHVVLSTGDISESGDNRYFTSAREQDTKDYTDAEVSEEASIRASEDVRILSEANAYTDMEVSEEAAARAAEDETLVKLDGSRPMTGDLDMGGQSITNVQEIVPPLNEFGFPESHVHIRKLSSVILDVTDTLSTPTVEGVYNEEAGKALLTLGSSIYADGYDITGLDTLQGDGSNDIEVASSLDMVGNRIKNLPTPSSSDEAATKGYVDGEIALNVTDKLGQPSGIATLDSSGKLSTSQLPSISITDVYVVTTLAERDALTVEEGDVVKVTEAVAGPSGTNLPRTYIWAVDNQTQMGSWLDIVTESDVDTVNGKVGTVVLDTDDISEGTSNKYFTDARARSAAVVNTLSGSETNQAPSVSSVKSFVDEFGERYKIESFTVSQQTIDSSSIDLTNKAFEMSIVVSIDRLMLLDGEDYTVSIVDGKSRLTFTGSLLQGQPEALEVGDKIRVRYLKDLRV